MANKIFSLVAPGGGGKTTTLKALVGMFSGWQSISNTIPDFRPGDDVGTCQHKGKCVGVLTDCDWISATLAFDRLVTLGCHIIFCPTHPQGRGGGLQYTHIVDQANNHGYGLYEIKLRRNIPHSTMATLLEDLI